MKQLVVFFLLVLLYGCKNSNEDIIGKIISANNSYKSIHYKLNELYYYSDKTDTIETPYEVWAIKDKKDSLRNGFVWADNNYRPYNMVYEKGDLYLTIPPKKTTILYKNFNEELISKVDWIDVFLRPELLKDMLKDKNFSIGDTLFDGKKCYKLNIEFPEKDSITESFLYIIDKKLKLPLYSEMKRTSLKHIYYDKLFFSDYSFDDVDIEKLADKHNKLLKQNPIGTKESNNIADRMKSMLQKGDKAPVFEGVYYGTNQAFNLEDYLGKNIIIIDFWYTHCPPCIKAMPAISSLAKKYKDDGLLVFGLNSVDNQKRSKGYLEKFLKKRKLNYDIVLINPEVDIKYKVNGYPTMYIIDMDGKIAFAELGYNEESFGKLKAEVKKMLGK